MHSGRAASANSNTGSKDLGTGSVAAAPLDGSAFRLHSRAAVFVVKRFVVEYLAAQGMAKPPAPPTPAQVARAALRRDYEGYRRLVLGALGEAGKQLRPTAPTKCQIGERHVGRRASPSAQVIGKANRADAGARWKEIPQRPLRGNKPGFAELSQM
jgi:hypothetical protein